MTRAENRSETYAETWTEAWADRTVPLHLGAPHSGYHWSGGRTRFFEGWYLRLTLPEVRQTFAFMYSIDDPGGGGEHSGGAALILGLAASAGLWPLAEKLPEPPTVLFASR